jgi:hypothetical protein
VDELETYKKLYLLQKEEIDLLKKSLEGHKAQVEHFQKLSIIQDKIIELQKEILNDFFPQKPKPHLRLVKDE